jgi:ribosomal protein L37E
MLNQEITCANCGWQWNTKDSKESDKYVCHKCGFDNSLKYRNLAKNNNMASVDNNFVEFVSDLKSVFEQSIVWHHQTDSYAVHKALNKFYDNILDLIDGLVESVSGIHGRPKNYEIDEPVNYKNPEQVINYFKSCYDNIQKDRKIIYEETWIQNQVDEIATLFAQTLYLLSLK